MFGLRFLALLLVVFAGCSKKKDVVRGDAGKGTDAPFAQDVSATDIITTSDTPVVSDDSGSTGQEVGPLANGVVLDTVFAFQNVVISIANKGNNITQRIAPVVTGRETLFRAYASPGPGWTPGASARATLTLETDGAIKTYKDTKPINAKANGNPTSFFSFDVPRNITKESTTHAIEIFDDNGASTPSNSTTDHPARLPKTGGRITLGARSNAGIDVVVVPVQYTSDGSNRLPDTSNAAMNNLKEHIRALFPATDVRLSVRSSAIALNTGIAFNGPGWQRALRRVGETRTGDRVGNEVYYVGLVNPALSRAQFCSRGCVAGIAPANTDRHPAFRYAIALGYATEDARFSSIHELSHAMGRLHAPSGSARQIDPNFPDQQNGRLDTFGYDHRSKTLFRPQTTYDYMGYSAPKWTSGYTARGLHQAMSGTLSFNIKGALAKKCFQAIVSDFEKSKLSKVGSWHIVDESKAEYLRAYDSNDNLIETVAAERASVPELKGGFVYLVPEVQDAAYFVTQQGKRISK